MIYLYPYSSTAKEHHMPERKPCDGSHNDYLRHRHHGEEPCRASKQAWALRQRDVRRRLKAEKLAEARR